MKRHKAHNYLISVVNDGKVTDLHWSENLAELKTLRLLHRSKEIGIMDMKEFKSNSPTRPCSFSNQKVKFSRNGKPANRVLCVETGVIYESVPEASRRLSIPRISIYHSIRRNIIAYGYHFKLLPPSESNK